MNHLRAEAARRSRARLAELEIELKDLRKNGNRRSSIVRQRIADVASWVRGLKHELERIAPNAKHVS